MSHKIVLIICFFDENCGYLNWKGWRISLLTCSVVKTILEQIHEKRIDFYLLYFLVITSFFVFVFAILE